ncbi:beta-glucuronidase, partial [bacterium]
DFPGQGSAIVGVLDAFWDEKGYVNAEDFRRFCSKTVPLARFPKFVFDNNETFHVDIEVAHFGPYPLKNSIPTWKIKDEKEIVLQGKFEPLTIPIDNCIPLGSIQMSLSDISKARKLNLEVNVGGYSNHWDFWVYPEIQYTIDSTEIYFCRELNDQAVEVLHQGGKVFLHAAGTVENGKDVVQYFRPVFWNTSWFKMQPPHTLGILCDPLHPAFQNFPTEYHSNLQWWEILHRQQVMNLEHFPPDFQPLIQPIDTWFLNRRLGMLFEARVSKGKLMVCSADLMTDLENRPAARQLFYSLTTYMISDKFMPQFHIDLPVIQELFEKKERAGIQLYTKASTDDLKPKVK